MIRVAWMTLFFSPCPQDGGLFVPTHEVCESNQLEHQWVVFFARDGHSVPIQKGHLCVLVNGVRNIRVAGLGCETRKSPVSP